MDGIDPQATLAAVGVALAAIFNTERRFHQNPQWRARLEDLGRDVPSYALVGYSGLVVFGALVVAIVAASRLAGWWSVVFLFAGWLLAGIPAALLAPWTFQYPNGKFRALLTVTVVVGLMNAELAFRPV